MKPGVASHNRFEERMHKVLDALHVPLTAPELYTATGLGSHQVWAALRKAKRLGLVRVYGRVRRRNGAHAQIWERVPPEADEAKPHGDSSDV